MFGSLNYDFTDAAQLRGGLRYTDDKKDFSAERRRRRSVNSATALTARPERRQGELGPRRYSMR